MFHVGGLVDLHAFMVLVDGVLLGDGHGGENVVAFGIEQRDFITVFQFVGGGLVR